MFLRIRELKKIKIKYLINNICVIKRQKFNKFLKYRSGL
jgi:hypothetical protein